MTATVVKGQELLFSEGGSNKWGDIKIEMVINLMDRWTYETHRVRGRKLLIFTTNGIIKILFEGGTPKLALTTYDKNQLVFSVVNIEEKTK